MRRLILILVLFAGLGLEGCAVYKDKEGQTHMELLPPPSAVYVAPAPPAYYYPYYGPYYAPYYYYPHGYYRGW